MPSSDQHADPVAGLWRSADAGRLAHAYLVVGNPEGEGMAFARSALKYMFCTGERRPCEDCPGCRGVERDTHPDILWVEPEKKSRIISVDQIRELNRRLAQTSYLGGWKAAAILHADRLRDESANAFLKTLEEPPGQTLLLLLTDAPQSLLPTIVSRCQRITLTERQGGADRPWLGSLVAILSEAPGSGPLAGMRLATRLDALLEQERERIRKAAASDAADAGEKDEAIVDARIEARLRGVRAAMLRFMEEWQRDVLLATLDVGAGLLHNPEQAETIRRQGASLTYSGALARLKAVEQMAWRLEHNISNLTVFEAGLGGKVGAGGPLPKPSGF